MNLQLAEGYNLSSGEFSLSASGENYALSDGSFFLSDGSYILSSGIDSSNYIFIPDGMSEGGGNWWNVREFADLNPAQFEQLLDAVLPYQPELDLREDGLGLFGLGKKAQQWKEQKRDAKLGKQAAKTAKIQSAANLKNAKASGTVPTASAGVGGALQGVLNTVGGIFGKGAGAGAAGRSAGGAAEDLLQSVTGGVQFGAPPVEEPSFLQQYGVYIAAFGIAAVIAYLAFRKK